MSKTNLCVFSPVAIFLKPITEAEADRVLEEEVRENVAGFILLITVLSGFFLIVLSLTIVLFIMYPLFSFVGAIFMALAISFSSKTFYKLKV